MTDPMIFVVGAVCLVVGAALVYVLVAGKSGSKLRDAEERLASARSEAERIAQEAARQAENAKKEAVLEAKERSARL